MTENKKSDELILFDEDTVAGILIKPWSFGTLFKISSLIEEILVRAEEKGIDLDNFFGEEEVDIAYTTIVKLFSLASEPLMKIIAITTKKEESDFEDISIVDGIKILMAIYRQNSEQVKNVSSLLLDKEVLLTDEIEPEKAD